MLQCTLLSVALFFCMQVCSQGMQVLQADHQQECGEEAQMACNHQVTKRLERHPQHDSMCQLRWGMRRAARHL